MTTVYLALGGNMVMLRKSLKVDPPPAGLCSYVYHRGYQEALPGLRQWCLDSGAYSAKHSGAEIKLQDYIDFCKRIADGENPPAEVFALDVIGDWVASKKNTEEMWRQGVPAIPCYHAGEPLDYLKGLAADYPKIAVGGAAGVLFGQARVDYLNQCFAHVWPKQIHGFGIAVPAVLFALPFHSADATSWEMGPMRYGNWKSYGTATGIRKLHDLRPEVRLMMDMEARLKHRWRKEMAEIA